MTGLRLGVATLLAALAAVGGFFLGQQSRQQDTAPPRQTAGAAQPMAANPTVPTWPSPAPDSDYPTLSTELRWKPVVMGSGSFRYRWVVPEDWDGNELGPNEWRWVPPGNPEGTHSMRVEVVASQHQTLDSILLGRIEALREASSVRDFTILSADLKESVLQYSYLSEGGRRRFNTLHWISLDGAEEAQIEIATDGRAIDRPGLQAMNQRLWDSVRRAS